MLVGNIFRGHQKAKHECIRFAGHIRRKAKLSCWKKENFERLATRHTKTNKSDFQKLDLFLKTRELSMEKAH